jgi:hypothetical protein
MITFRLGLWNFVDELRALENSQRCRLLARSDGAL